MARNEELFLQGKVKWARTKIPGQYGKWSVVLYPDAPSLEKIQELIKDGIKNELKKDEDGYYITFSRPLDKKDRQGRTFTFTPPVVVDKDNRVLEGLIGNGSDCSIKLDIYGGTRPGGGTYKAARLDGIKVHNLIPYVVEESSNDPRVIKSVSGLDKQPEPTNRW